MEVLINDTRTESDFRIITFSGYKKTEAKNQLIISILQGKVEPACYWSAELICSGHFMDIWETLIVFMGKHIHLGNPKLAIYMEKRFEIFRNIMMQKLYFQELDLRNNTTIRHLFAEMIAVFALSPKKLCIECTKMNAEEFDITLMSEKLKATHANFAEPIFLKDDPKEVLIAINELMYHLTLAIPNMQSACYWVEWMIEFSIICKKRKLKCTCHTRYTIPVEHKYQKEIIWMVWDTLFFAVKKKGPFYEKLMDSLLCLFCIQYTPASNKKRRYILYYAISVITEMVQPQIEMISDKGIVANTIDQIHNVYSQIQKNQVSPNTEYLFTGLHENHSSLDKIQLLYG